MNTKILSGVVLAMAALVVGSAQAYVPWNSKWPQPQTTFYVDIAGNGGQWNTAFEEAMASWAPSGFRFAVVRNSYSDPCNSSDRRNGVRFHTDLCGSAFGSTTLAVTRSYRSGSTTVETDIVFNANKTWNLYSTTLWSSPGVDFQRVAVHELGHALGLDHESSAPAIMAPYVGNLIAPQADDIAGVRAVYGTNDDYGDSMADAHTVKPNSTTPGLIGSGSDVDFFRIDIAAYGRLALRSNGTTDTVGTLYSSSGTVLGANDDGCSNGKNFCLTRMLDAGTYYLKVDGYGSTATGAYSLVSQYAEDDYGNAIAEAHPLAMNTGLIGQINTGGDLDFFKLVLPRQGYLLVATGGFTDTVGTLYTSSGTVVATDDDSCRNTNFCIRKTMAAGTYYLKVAGKSGSTIGPYKLAFMLR